MSSRLNQRGPAHPRKLRRAAAAIGLVVLGAALGLLGGGLWLHARLEAPSRAASPFTLGLDPQHEPPASLDRTPLDDRRMRHH